ncbi:MAG: hypothetical protein BGO45_14380 [Microbacterium sp. 71-36]|mgnify:CR=1 FL=1|nr:MULTISPECIES: HNH endonuclease signature motif containing protein [unclassified Microbacterium]ODT37603.1 MAG: hypothetical protein ABS60_12680 [Microbacterium sp. SCN 71-17]OJV77883.1 MAG: hypothetical protein BGO45_14380 [Microbacterium sp. 71-36]
MPPIPIPQPSSIDDDRLRELVAAIRDESVRAARVHAALVRLRAEALRIALDEVARSRSRATREREMPIRSLALEVAVATHSHDLTVQKELSDAHTLTEKFAATVDALAEGRIGVRHAQAILETGIVLDDDATRAGWEQVVLTRAEHDSPGRVKAFGRELAESVHPIGMTARHARAAAARGVSVRDLADGMAELSVILPATVAYGIRDRLRRQAAAIRAAAIGADAGEEQRDSPEEAEAHGTEVAGHDAVAQAAVAQTAVAQAAAGHEVVAHAETTSHEADTSATMSETARSAPETQAVMSAAPSDDTWSDTRTLAQIGADLCADLLLTAAPAIDPTDDTVCPGGLGAIRGHVQVTVPALTLIGRTDGGASIDGLTPIDPDTARHLAARAPGWDRLLCDPVTGSVLEVDRYAPTTCQRRFLAARDRHCRAPGCRAPIARCQIDHNHEAHEGGPTRLDNLCHLCVRHHTLKTETEWTVTQERDGTLRFHSPLGQEHRERVPARVMFVPDADPPPF